MSTVTLTMPDGEARKPYEFRQVLKGTGPFKIIAALLPDGLKAQITGSTLVIYGTLPQGTNVFPVTVASRDKLPIERNSQLKAKVTVMLRDVAVYDVAAAA